MSKPKRDPILCTEIIPGAVYLAPRRHNGVLKDEPVTISCTDEPGWLRGFVNVLVERREGSGCTGVVPVKFIEDGSLVELPVVRSPQEGEPWMFATGPEKWQPVTLRRLPEGWFEQRYQDIQQQIDQHVLAIGKLEDQRSAIQVLHQKVASHTSAND